jgi:hypothetical protein
MAPLKGLTMSTLNVLLNGRDCWEDVRPAIGEGPLPAHVIHLGNGAPPIGVAAIEGGMLSGATSVMFRIDLPDGRVVLAETSLALLEMAVQAMRARYPV